MSEILSLAAARSRMGRVFYGWWMVVAGLLIMAVNGGTYFYGFGVFFVPLETEFGWSRTVLAGAFSLSRLEAGLTGPIGGWLVDRFGPRRLMLVGWVLFGLSFIVLSQVNSLWAFYAVFVLGLAVAGSLGSGTPVQTSIANWFVRKRSQAIGIAMSGAGVAGIMVPGMAWLIEQYSWRGAAIIAGLAALVFCLPLSLVMRHRPERYGLLPDGDDSSTQSLLHRRKPATWRFLHRWADSSRETEVDFTTREALKTSAFWLISAFFTVRMLVTAAVVVHLAPFFTDLGVSLEVSAMILGSVATISVVGRVLFGWLGDVFDKRYVLGICYSMMAISLLILAFANNWWQTILFIALYSPSYGGSVPLVPALRGQYFGRKTFGTIHGLTNTVAIVGTAGGPLLAGYIYDATGSYRLAFLIFAAITALGIILVMATRQPKLARAPAAL
ncbi:MAG: MFS transporter [Chloroflexi bacterium]|nr:MFS transporter [Chloroflexota bacterium]